MPMSDLYRQLGEALDLLAEDCEGSGPLSAISAASGSATSSPQPSPDLTA